MVRTASTHAQAVAARGAEAIQRGESYLIPTSAVPGPRYEPLKYKPLKYKPVKHKPVKHKARPVGSGSRIKPAHAAVPESLWETYRPATPEPSQTYTLGELEAARSLVGLSQGPPRSQTAVAASPQPRRSSRIQERDARSVMNLAKRR